MMKRKVTIYTDGACSGNPGAGGFGAILMFDGHRKEVSAGYRMTTNNRMELLGVITALSMLKEPCEVLLYTDSQYVVNGIEKGWAVQWKQSGWKKADKKPAQNSDLWDMLLAYLELHEVKFNWVKGHAENEFNNDCDRLAVEASRNPQFDDLGFEAKEI